MATARFTWASPRMYSSTSSGMGRTYSHNRSPVTASIACVTSFGFGMYSTPPYASGVPWLVPGRMARVQTMRISPTFARSIWFSGL